MEAKLEQVPLLAYLPDDSRQEFDAIGTSLWNTCGHLASTHFASREDRKVLGRGMSLESILRCAKKSSLTPRVAKTIAFILIDAIAPNRTSGIVLPI